MASIGYGTGAYKRSNGNFPPLTLINMFVEKAKTSENEVALLSRKGLGVLVTNGSGPINGLYSKQGTFSGDVFSISGTALYRGTVAVTSGTIAGTGRASFAGSATELIVTRGTVPRSYNGTNIADITFPDTANVIAVEFIGELFVAVRGGSQKYYWSAPLDGRTWNALDFASAEREPDQLLDVKSLGDNLWLFGQSTIECHANTGDADLPFTRIEQVAFDKGIHSTGCVVKADNSLVFVGSDSSVYRISDVPQKISDNSIDERILASATVKMFTHKIDGHEMVTFRLATETLELDLSTGEWHENQTNGGNWIAADCAMVGKVAYFGHSSTGQIMGWDEWDDLGDEMERRFTAAQQLDAPMSVNNLRLWCNVGESGLLSGQGSDPVIEMRSTRDAGRTWSDYDSASLGNAALGGTGQYRVIPQWRRLGMFDFPGAMFEFRVTDPVPVRVSAVKINEPGGGRSRV